MSANVSDYSGTGDSIEDLSPLNPIRRAKVWEYFEQNLLVVDGVPKAVCKYCQLRLTCNPKSGTSSLRNHIAESCPTIDNSDRKRFLATIKKQSPHASFVFDAQKTRELITKFCIHAEVPFQKFEDPYFKDWMASMQPTFKVFGRQTVRSDCFSLYERMKLELRVELQSLDSRICLTSDLWTSVQNLGYMCVTAHFIDANFNLKKKIIAFKDAKYPHTGLAIEEAITKCLTEWGIKGKLFTLTLDNASNNNAACRLLQENQEHDLLFDGQHFHIKCCAHILNILVQDGMKLIHVAIGKIRHLLRHIESSPSRLQAFNGIAARMGLPAKSGLILDVPNRWNFTFHMIGEALEYKVVLNRYAIEKSEPSPDDQEWTNAAAIWDFLKAFEEATKVVSADRTPTSHLFLHIVLCISHALEDREWQINDALKALAGAMHTKLIKYWDNNFNIALVIATVLDPSKKLDYLDFFYEKVCENVDDIDRNVESAKDWTKMYFQKYEQLVTQNSEHAVSCASDTGRSFGSPVLGKRKIEEEFAQYRSQRRRWREPRSELDMYLDDEFEKSTDKFNVLSWWKQHAEKYPVLSVMARDFLAIPLSTVSLESAFSCSGRILGDTRSSLTPEMLEALVCGKDWLTKVPICEGENVGIEVIE